MEPFEWKAATLCSLFLLFTTTTTESASFQGSSDAGAEYAPVDLNDMLIDDRLGWESEGTGVLPEEEKRAFHAMRGKKEDDAPWAEGYENKRAFHAMRGKRLLAPASVDSFIAQLRRAVLQGKRGSAFIGMRGKRHSDNTPLFYAPRGKRSVAYDPSTKQHF